MNALLAAPILLSLTLVVSGIAKLPARQATQDAMRSLRLPLVPAHRAAATALPGMEIALALALWVPVPAVQTTAAVLIAALMTTYLVIIARALTFEETVECSCFGSLASPTVSRVTLARNILLTLLGVLGIGAAASGSISRAVLETPLAVAAGALTLVVAAALTALALGGTRAASPAPTTQNEAAPLEESAEGEEELDYERERIPAGVLQAPDGELISLRQLVHRQAALLLFVSEGCGPCERVMDQLAAWTPELFPYMQVKTVFSRPIDRLRPTTRHRVGEHALHDLQFSAREALGARTAPSAVLLGADGLLAGGPVAGATEVFEFVEEIRQQLQAAQEDGELPDPDSPELTDA